jgi:hypothetical protein
MKTGNFDEVDIDEEPLDRKFARREIFAAFRGAIGKNKSERRDAEIMAGSAESGKANWRVRLRRRTERACDAERRLHTIACWSFGAHAADRAGEGL